MTASLMLAALAVVAVAPPRPLVGRIAESLRDSTPEVNVGKTISLRHGMPALDAGASVGLRPGSEFYAEIAAAAIMAERETPFDGGLLPTLSCPHSACAEVVPVEVRAIPNWAEAGGDVPRIAVRAAPTAAVKAPAVAVRGPRNLSDGTADALLATMVCAGLEDGTLPPRLPKWRPILLDMLAGRIRAGDFDRVFELLLATFPGSDQTAKVSAVLKWAAGLTDAKDSADVCRALTRRYISTGEYDLAISAADLMAEYHAGYRPNALYLKAHAHAFAGRFDDARSLLSEALALGPDGGARARILYLQAWILLQEGDVDAAVPLLKDVAERHSSTKYARQSAKILESLEHQ